MNLVTYQDKNINEVVGHYNSYPDTHIDDAISDMIKLSKRYKIVKTVFKGTTIYVKTGDRFNHIKNKYLKKQSFIQKIINKFKINL